MTHREAPIPTRAKMSSSMPSSRLSIVHLCIDVKRSVNSGMQMLIAQSFEARQQVETHPAGGADARVRMACCTRLSVIGNDF